MFVIDFCMRINAILLSKVIALFEFILSRLSRFIVDVVLKFHPQELKY